MSENNNNYSILPWYTDQRYQNHRKRYAYGRVFGLVCAQYRLPCFQIHRTTALGAPITSCIITNISTGTTYDITTGIVIDGGLNIQQFTPTGSAAYDLIVYPGLANITDITPPEGQYDAVMTDGTNTWYSERFYMRAYLDDLIKISYWNTKPFIFPNSHISYTSPFANFIYLNSLVNRPEYEEEEEVEKRDGYIFPIYQISKKVFRIVGVLLPEYLLDALRVVWMHTNVTVQYDGIIYPTDSIRIIYEEWESIGDLRPISIEFTTNTVVTQTGFVEDENDGGDYDQTDYNDDFLIT